MANAVSIDTSTPGSKTFSVTSTDVAGNSTTVTNTYTVDPHSVFCENKPVTIGMNTTAAMAAVPPVTT